MLSAMAWVHCGEPIPVRELGDIWKDMLCCHKSQKDWLDISQGNDAYLDDMEVRTETINPKNSANWRPSFTGDGIGRVSIYIDDELYMEYIVDFEEGVHEIDTDFSAEFQE